jgi:murein tripeptide amidase MpaA
LISKYGIGTSLEGRTLYAVTITSPVGGPDKPALCFNADQHAREWITPMTAMYIIDRLVQTYDTDPDVQMMLDRLIFYIVPINNPDGYVYSWDVDRMWRKNRRNNGDGTYGVDLNRNWSVGWGGPGSDGETYSETYRGPWPFSEPETQVVRDYILDHPEIVGHVDIHSYGQLAMWPYGYDYIEPPEPDRSIMSGIANDMVDAIFATHGVVYTPQPCHQLYLCSGICIDWVYDEGGAYSWTFELRDTGYYGFILPPEQILPTGEEIYAAISTLAEYFTLLLRIDFPDGLPAIVEPEQTTSVAVRITEIAGTLDPDSPRIFHRIGDSGEFTEAALTPLGGENYEAELPAATCGSQIQYYFQAQTTGGETITEPYDAPASLFVSEAWEITVAFEDHMETDLGWTVGSPDDDATTGIWNRMDPEPTPAQPGDDHTPDGTICWVTDGRGGSVGAYDVDDGQTTLTTPTLDLGDMDDPIVSYWRWYSNDEGASPNADVFVVDISDDDGENWANVETVGPAGPETSGDWFYHEFRVVDFAAPTAQVKLRFIASDEGSGSIVEAAVDDFVVMDIGCGEPECPGDLDGDGARDLTDLAILLAHYGITEGATYEDGDMDGDGDVDLSDLSALLAVYGEPC